MYDPVGNSPEAIGAKYFWKTLSDGVAICGPSLAWRKGDVVKRTKFSLDDEKDMAVKPLPNGWALVGSGPYSTTLSRFGSGQCGACEIAHYDVFAISPQGEITQAATIEQDESGENGQPNGAEIKRSDDWKKIMLSASYDGFELDSPVKPYTVLTTYCLAGHVYKQCGEPKKTFDAQSGPGK